MTPAQRRFEARVTEEEARLERAIQAEKVERELQFLAGSHLVRRADGTSRCG